MRDLYNVPHIAAAATAFERLVPERSWLQERTQQVSLFTRQLEQLATSMSPLYRYVHNSPVVFVDPSGMMQQLPTSSVGMASSIFDMQSSWSGSGRAYTPLSMSEIGVRRGQIASIDKQWYSLRNKQGSQAQQLLSQRDELYNQIEFGMPDLTAAQARGLNGVNVLDENAAWSGFTGFWSGAAAGGVSVLDGVAFGAINDDWKHSLYVNAGVDSRTEAITDLIGETSGGLLTSVFGGAALGASNKAINALGRGIQLAERASDSYQIGAGIHQAVQEGGLSLETGSNILTGAFGLVGSGAASHNFDIAPRASSNSVGLGSLLEANAARRLDAKVPTRDRPVQKQDRRRIAVPTPLGVR